MLCTSGTFEAFVKYKLSLWHAQWKYTSFLFPVISQNWFDAPFFFQKYSQPYHMFVTCTVMCLNELFKVFKQCDLLILQLYFLLYYGT